MQSNMDTHAEERALMAAIECVASGLTKSDTEAYLHKYYGRYVSYAVVPVILRDARIEAENQGVERDDIDDSWYR